jgi:hypothetical protein
MEVKEEYEDGPLLLHFFPLKNHPKMVTFVPSNLRTRLSPSLTWQGMFSGTLSHLEKSLLLMPSSRCEKLFSSIQLMDSLQQAHLHHAVAFPWLTCKSNPDVN